jgi:L,D-transpeptidase YcbB
MLALDLSTSRLVSLMSLLQAVTCDALWCDAAHSLHRCCGVTRRLKDLHSFAGTMSAKGIAIAALMVCTSLFGDDGGPGFPTVSAKYSPSVRATRLPLTPQGAAFLRNELAAVESSELPKNAQPNLSTDLERFYASLGGSLAWFEQGAPTPAACQIIEELKHADKKGLRARDYDGPLWDSRVAFFTSSNSYSEAEQVQFDVALTVNTMRFLSHLHLGRVNPHALRFDIKGEKSFDLSDFMRSKVIYAKDVDIILESVEPQFLAYRRTLRALSTYLELARKEIDEPLPASNAIVRAGDSYAPVPILARRLRLLGDLDGEQKYDHSDTYTTGLATALARFQRRHGLTPNGYLDSPTLVELNTPLRYRVLQLQLTLERWRWLPHTFSRPPIVVNIPEFRLYAINEDHHVALAMNVVAGHAFRHETPVFMSAIQSVTFRPYWNVPLTIQQNELLPQVLNDPSYLSENSYEIVGARDQVEMDSGDEQERTAKLRSGEWLLRQRPGPRNSLGLVKFELPNPYDIYLHGTPSQELFAQSRRDFSHGCIRVEDPVGLAVWVLRGNPGWDQGHVQAAMEGNVTLRVNLKESIPAWILYGTAVVQEDGEVHFLADIYGHDAALERALEQQYSDVRK